MQPGGPSTLHLLMTTFPPFRLSSSCLRHPTTCGIYHEFWLYISSWGQCSRILPATFISFSCWKPGSSWETVPHSLQSAASVGSRNTKPGSTWQPAIRSTTGSFQFSYSAQQSDCSTATDSSYGSATAAVSYKTYTDTGQEHPTSPQSSGIFKEIIHREAMI